MTDEQIEFALKRYATCKCTDVINMDWGAVLNYIDRLKDQLYQAEQKLAECDDLELYHLQMKNGEIDMTFGSDDCSAFIYPILQIFKQNGGENFVTTIIEASSPELDGRYELTIQKVGGITPIEKARQDTAKEILQEVWNTGGTILATQQLAAKYGVKIDK